MKMKIKVLNWANFSAEEAKDLIAYLSKRIEETSYDELTHLHLACMHGAKLDVINLFIAVGADTEHRNKWSGKTALHYAVEFKNYDAVNALINANANPEAKDKRGKRPQDLTTDKKILKTLTNNIGSLL